MTPFVRTVSQASPRRSSGVPLPRSSGPTATRSRGMGRPTSNQCRWYVPCDVSGGEKYMIHHRDSSLSQGRSIINPNFLRAYYIHWGSVLPGQEISHPHGKCMFLLHLFRLVSHWLGIHVFSLTFTIMLSNCRSPIFNYCLTYCLSAGGSPPSGCC